MGASDERAPGYLLTFSFLGTDVALWWKRDRPSVTSRRESKNATPVTTALAHKRTAARACEE
jgi:hypothetical protein